MVFLWFKPPTSGKLLNIAPTQKFLFQGKDFHDEPVDGIGVSYGIRQPQEWLVVTGTWILFSHINWEDVTIPIDKLIFFRVVQTTNQPRIVFGVFLMVICTFDCSICNWSSYLIWISCVDDILFRWVKSYHSHILENYHALTSYSRVPPILPGFWPVTRNPGPMELLCCLGFGFLPTWKAWVSVDPFRTPHCHKFMVFQYVSIILRGQNASFSSMFFHVCPGIHPGPRGLHAYEPSKASRDVPEARLRLRGHPVTGLWSKETKGCD